MKTELVQTLTAAFEAHAQRTEGGIEYWLAHDIHNTSSATMNGGISTRPYPERDRGVYAVDAS